MIEVHHLRKRFGEILAVDDVSFAAADGKVTGLLGPNGAGKTTTLRMLYGLVEPDGGRVSIDGVDVTKAPLEARRRIGALPDAQGLYVRLTAREHLEYFGRLHGLRGQVLKEHVDRLIDLLDMHDTANRRVEGFSHGERVRVAVGRALVHSPPNVLLDEPTNGLDVSGTRAMRQLIRHMRADGKCVVFSSHIMQEVSALCDEIVIVSAGRVVARGVPEELLAQSGQSSLEDAFVFFTGIDEVAA